MANKTGVSRKGVLKRWMETGDSRCQPRSGKKRKSVTRCDRTLIRISLRNKKLTSKELSTELKESSGVELSAPTVRRRLLENGLRGCKARKKPLLTEKQRKHRLEWARSHVKWPVEKWRKVLFSDESTFTLNNHAGNNYVRRPEEEYRPYCMSPTIKHPQSIMVWGCMAASGIGRLKLVSGMMNGTKYSTLMCWKTKCYPVHALCFPTMIGYSRTIMHHAIVLRKCSIGMEPTKLNEWTGPPNLLI